MNEIVNMDKEGQFIPFCTKMVFLKYYTPSENNQLHFWGQADRRAYISFINSMLNDKHSYLKEPITMEQQPEAVGTDSKRRAGIGGLFE